MADEEAQELRVRRQNGWERRVGFGRGDVSVIRSTETCTIHDSLWLDEQRALLDEVLDMVLELRNFQLVQYEVCRSAHRGRDA